MSTKLHKLNERVYYLLTIMVTPQKNDQKYRLKQMKAEKLYTRTECIPDREKSVIEQCIHKDKI